MAALICLACVIGRLRVLWKSQSDLRQSARARERATHARVANAKKKRPCDWHLGTSTPLAQMAFSLTSSVNGVRVAAPKARAARVAVAAAPTASLQKVRFLLELL